MNATYTAEIEYAMPAMRLPQNGPLKPGRPQPPPNRLGSPNVQARMVKESMIQKGGTKAHVSHGAAAMKAASTSRATTPRRSGPRFGPAGPFIRTNYAQATKRPGPASAPVNASSRREWLFVSDDDAIVDSRLGQVSVDTCQPHR